MDEEVIRAQIAMNYTSTVDISDRFNSLSKPFLSKGERYGVVLSVQKALEAAMAGLSKE